MRTPLGHNEQAAAGISVAVDTAQSSVNMQWSDGDGSMRRMFSSRQDVDYIPHYPIFFRQLHYENIKQVSSSFWFYSGFLWLGLGYVCVRVYMYFSTCIRMPWFETPKGAESAQVRSIHKSVAHAVLQE